MKSVNPTKTSWDSVADWYDDLLEKDADSFQKNVIMPNILRIVAPKKGMSMVDLACGQGYFARAFHQNGASVIGYDISKELITLALEQLKKGNESKNEKGGADNESNKIEPDSKKTRNNLDDKPTIQFHVSPADSIPFIQNNSIDVVTIILALQNIENMSGVFAECSRVLKPKGKVVFVINHPAFRIPKRSGWGEETVIGKTETLLRQGFEGRGRKDGKTVDTVSIYRKINSYMSDDQIKIDMTPGEKDEKKKKFTVSFHRPLQSYFKVLSKNGLAVTRLEEWISHKKSQAGPHADEEDRIRKEIPMFLCVEGIKV